MKKFIILIVTSCIVLSCSNRTDIGELISLRNNYQAEYNLLHSEWNYREFIALGYHDEYSSFYGTFEENMREKLCKDSIEILNAEIERYKNRVIY